MKKKIVKYILIGLLVLFIGIQFIRPEKNLGTLNGPNDISHYVPVPENVNMILQRSCYDCHSNHTNYPWYVNVNPIALFMGGHITDGKAKLNFSDLSKFNERRLSHKLNSIADQVEQHDMPIGSYTLIHRNAVLNDTEIKIIKDWSTTASQQIVFKK
ncbi:MAG: heme-binding domain-containing protein [Mucilaginibacter sp.]